MVALQVLPWRVVAAVLVFGLLAVSCSAFNEVARPSISCSDVREFVPIQSSESLYRSPSEYEDKCLLMGGHVVQRLGGATQFVVRLGQDRWTDYYDRHILLIGDSGCPVAPGGVERVIEEDEIVFVGQFKGMVDMETLEGRPVSMPRVDCVVGDLTTLEAPPDYTPEPTSAMEYAVPVTPVTPVVSPYTFEPTLTPVLVVPVNPNVEVEVDETVVSVPGSTPSGPADFRGSGWGAFPTLPAPYGPLGPMVDAGICQRGDAIQEWIGEQLSMSHCEYIDSDELAVITTSLEVDFDLEDGDLAGLVNLSSLTLSQPGVLWNHKPEVRRVLRGVGTGVDLVIEVQLDVTGICDPTPGWTAWALEQRGTSLYYREPAWDRVSFVKEMFWLSRDGKYDELSGLSDRAVERYGLTPAELTEWEEQGIRVINRLNRYAEDVGRNVAAVRGDQQIVFTGRDDGVRPGESWQAAADGFGSVWVKAGVDGLGRGFPSHERCQ